jgi:F-type H+-transporting ATPase subunit alpha
MSITDQVISIFAGARGHLDDVPVDEVPAFEADLLAHLKDKNPELYQELAATGAFTRDSEKELSKAIEAYKEAQRSKKPEAAAVEPLPPIPPAE